MPSNSAVACVMGDMDMIRPLGLAGVSCAPVAGRWAPVRFSRFSRDLVDPRRPSLMEALLDYARSQPEPPVLYYESDWSLLFVASNRERLAGAYRFLMPDPDLVQELLDKGRFQALAERLDLPVPRSRLVAASDGDPSLEELDLRFPVIVKPLPYRDERWEAIDTSVDAGVAAKPEALRELSAKVVRAETPAALRSVWPRLTGTGLQLLVQEMVPGPERQIVSYHGYVDQRGELAGEFTGSKIRTYPPEFGRSTALTTTHDPEVTALGRKVIERLGLKGVAKVDFKRAPDGRLNLLEVNPRFSLWCHLGAVAGVNLPALVHADLTGQARPHTGPARPGVTWCRSRADAMAARAMGVPFRKWLRFALGCEINAALAWDDPIPFLWRKAFSWAATEKHVPVSAEAGAGPGDGG